MMSSNGSGTIVRVKRRLEESPADALVLHCKRIKSDREPDTVEDVTQLDPSVFVFSGTVNEKDHSQVSHIKKSWLKHQGKSHYLDTTLNIPDLLKKLKAEHNLQTQKNRIEVVNYSRGIKLSSEEGGGDSLKDPPDDHCTVLDLHHSQENKDGDKSTPSTSSQYEYDLYLSHQKDFDVNALDDIVRVDPYHGDLKFGPYRENGSVSSDDDADRFDEDSNDENNYKNDYPSTDDSIQEEDMRRAMRNCSIDDTLSSDEFDESLPYGAKSSGDKNYLGVKSEDVDRYGLAYAKYKAKLARGKLTVDGEPSLIDVEEDKYYSPANSRSGDGLDSDDDDNDNDEAEDDDS